MATIGRYDAPARLARDEGRKGFLPLLGFGDTAIVHGLETEKSMTNGKDSSGQFRFTDVFVKCDGVWMAVAEHDSKVKAK